VRTRYALHEDVTVHDIQSNKDGKITGSCDINGINYLVMWDEEQQEWAIVS
jgi:hypothetical protein